MRRALAAIFVAAVIPISAAKCGGGGQHQGMPVHTRNWWHQAPQYQGGFIVFGEKPPAGQWEQVGWVRRPPGTKLPRVRVWVQK